MASLIVGLVTVAAIPALFLLWAGIYGLATWRGRRLARQAIRRREDGSRGILARRALRILLRKAEHSSWDWIGASQALAGIGDPDWNEAAWESWLRGPGDADWALLADESGPPAGLLERVFAAGVAPSLDAQARGRIGAFCARHGLAPGEAASRAVFFLLTGQAQQHRAADPDGSLLAACYQAAGDATRAALRQALVSAGDLDLVRAIAERGHLAADMTGEEVGYLARGLAGRGEFEQLWRLALHAPLEQAVAVAPLLHGWQPPDEAGQRLLARLLATSPGLVTEARRALHVPTPAVLAVLEHVTSVSFAPDLSQVAVASADGNGTALRLVGEQMKAALDIFALPGGQRIARHVSGRYLTQSAAHLGGAVLAAQVRRHAPGQRFARHVLRRYADGSDKALRRALLEIGEWSDDEEQLKNAWCWRLARGGPGFAAAAPDGSMLILGGERGGWSLRVPLRTVMRGPGRVRLGGDPGSGRIALASEAGLVILDREAEVLARTEPGSYRSAEPVFCTPDQLITLSREHIRLWRRSGTVVESVAQRELPERIDTLEVAAFPAAGRVACRLRNGRVVWFDTGTLAPADPAPGMPDGPADGLWGSGGSEYLAVASPGQVRVSEAWPSPAARLLTVPMAGMGPADLAEAAGLERAGPSPEGREALGLLRACLQQRFGADVGLGGGPQAVTAEDVGLQPGGYGRC
jgi:hypothetical protein